MWPSRIFVEEAYILKNASKLANIPVHIVQVRNLPNLKCNEMRDIWGPVGWVHEPRP